MPKTTKNTEPVACRCSIYTAVVREIQDADGNMIDIEEIETGCTATTKNEFAQGHDAKLKSFLIAAGVRELEVARVEGGLRISNDAVGMASEYGFADMVAAGIAKGKAKLEAAQKRADAKHERAAAKAAKATPAPAPAVEEAPEAQAEVTVVAFDSVREVMAKVGRWTYKGTEDTGTFTYQAKLGGRKTTDKYEVIEVL